MSLKLYIEQYGDNSWTERINKYIPHQEVSIEECDYIVSSKIPYGCINPSVIQDALKSYEGIHKNIIVFLLSDYNEPFDIPQNVLLFRAGLYKSQRKPNEFLIPHIWTEDGIGTPFLPLPKRGIHPLVGFCGTMTSHPCRVQHINKIKSAPDIKNKFIIRDKYWAGKPHDKQVVNDFVKNIQETYFTLCSRGAGNWSARFYQVLYLGRIPIVVNTDLILPFEDKINWRDIIVFCDSENDIANNVRIFWRNKDINQVQIKCKEVYDTYLAPEKWCAMMADDILIPALKRT
jgi:hypothetical protein